MQVSPINNAQNFKGLWGVPQKLAVTNEFTSVTYITKTYYPFKDESKESVDAVVRANQSSYHENWYQTGEMYVDEKTDVDVKKPLSFTEKEFLNYEKSGLGATKPEEIRNPVEKELVNRGLYQHLNKSQNYIKELNWRASYSYKILNFFKKMGKKLKNI